MSSWDTDLKLAKEMLSKLTLDKGNIFLLSFGTPPNRKPIAVFDNTDDILTFMKTNKSRSWESVSGRHLTQIPYMYNLEG